MKNIKISICLTTFNRSELLEKTINNVINQSYTNFELIVIDDCSETEHQVSMLSLLKCIIDPRVTYIMNQENNGLAHNRNLAINQATGDYFTFKDDDDEWDRDFLLEMVNTVVSCDVPPEVILTGYKNVIRDTTFYFKEQTTSLYECFLLGYTPPVGGQFYNLPLVKSVDGYSDVKTGVDHDLWINIVASKPHAKVTFIGRSLVTPDAFALPGSIKMTTNFNKRVVGINNSLVVWREKLISTFGKAFYLHFRHQYNSYLCQRFLTFAVKNRDTGLLFRICKCKYLIPHILNSIGILIHKLYLSRFSNDNELLPLFNRFRG
jgi:glycosyltransferase involved in cell wall biosynthesis